MGRVTVDGDDTTRRSVAQLSRRVGIVFQNPDHLLFSETVREEVGFALKNFGFEPGVIVKQVERTLEALDLAHYADTSPFLLRGGGRWRGVLGSVSAGGPGLCGLWRPIVGGGCRSIAE